MILNNQPFQFKVSNLPCLIHGTNKTGSSLFTVTLLADLFKQGNKVLLISGYHMARDEFLNQTKSPQSKILIECESDLNNAYSKDVIMVKRENSDWFIRLAQNLLETNDRIILVKNFDLFDDKIFDAVKNSKNIILSGNLNQCSFGSELVKYPFISHIYFSQSQIDLSRKCPVLEKYFGYLWNKERSGIVKITE